MRAMAEFVAEFFPPDLSSAFLAKTAWGALQTLRRRRRRHPARGRRGERSWRCRRPVASAWRARPRARLALNVLRSVPELVWAALMVLAAGLGPFAGTLALALHTTGVLGRLFAESLENAPSAPERSLREAGSGAVAAFAYASAAAGPAAGLAYALYRWEMNIRMAAVLGFVGAGGLGQMLYFHLSIFQQAQAATLLIAMFVLVFAVDSLSAAVRDRLVPAQG